MPQVNSSSLSPYLPSLPFPPPSPPSLVPQVVAVVSDLKLPLSVKEAMLREPAAEETTAAVTAGAAGGGKGGEGGAAGATGAAGAVGGGDSVQFHTALQEMQRGIKRIWTEKESSADDAVRGLKQAQEQQQLASGEATRVREELTRARQQGQVAEEVRVRVCACVHG
jgi:hypothetical protein